MKFVLIFFAGFTTCFLFCFFKTQETQEALYKCRLHHEITMNKINELMNEVYLKSSDLELLLKERILYGKK